MRASLLRLALAWAIACSGLAASQGVGSTGTSSAALALSGRVAVEPLLRLGLSADSLLFDLRPAGAARPGQLCVNGSGVDLSLGAGLLGDDRVAPSGTDFRVADFPSIEIVGGEALNPTDLAFARGQVVCYRTFTLDVFSNQDAWQLRADRIDVDDGGREVRVANGSLDGLYLGAACPQEHGGGLAAMPPGARTTLVSQMPAGSCRAVLVVVALKVLGEPAGVSTAEIRYTLLSPDAAFDGR